MSTPEDQAEPSEAELRAAFEEEMKRFRVEDLVLQSLATILNTGIRRSGLAPGTEEERDWDQVRVAIEAVRGLAPVVEQIAPDQGAPIRDALSQLQMAYVRERGGAPGPGEPPAGGEGTAPEPEKAASAPGQEGSGPAQSSGRLWVPGR